MRIISGVLAVLMLPIYLGQIISVANLPLARRLGLQETAETIDPVYARDTAGTARWDVLSMWTLPVAGILALTGSDWWPALALIGGAIYIDTGGRQSIKLLGYRREGVRVGTANAVGLALGVYVIFIVVGATALVAALVAIDPT